MKFRKFLAVVMAAAVAFCGMAFTASAADPITATIGFADTEWGAQDWMSSCEVTGDGTYSITARCVLSTPDRETGTIIETLQPGSGVSVMTVNFVGLSKQLGDLAKNVKVSNVKVVTGGGASLAIDQSKVLIGDLEANGNLRIEIYNSYGRTARRQQYDPAVSPINPADFSFTAEEQFTITFTLTGLDAALAGEPAETEAPAETTEATTTTEVTTTTEATTTTTEATTTTTTTTTTAATTTTTTTAATTTTTEVVTETETTTPAEETETEETEAETTTTTKATTTTAEETTSEETEAETTTSAAPVTTQPVEQAVSSEVTSDFFAARNSQLIIFAIIAGVIILAVIVVFVLMALKKKK